MKVNCIHASEVQPVNWVTCALCPSRSEQRAGGPYFRPNVAICESACKARVPLDTNKPSLIDIGVSFSKSMASRGVNNARVDSTTFQLRVLACHGDASNSQAACGARVWNEEGGYHACSECNCPLWKLAALSQPGSKPNAAVANITGPYIKLHTPVLDCPRKKPGFSNAG